MKIPSLVCALFTASLSLVRAQDNPAKAEPPPSAQAPQPVTPEAASKEALRLAGFPTNSLKYEPALAAAFQLTDGQAESLKSAWKESVQQTKEDLGESADSIQVRKSTKLAAKDFKTRRDSILSGEQLSLITTINEAFAATRNQLKEGGAGKSTSHEKTKEVFLEKIKVSLTAEQLALVRAAGGKLP
jgi:primosomal protein N'